MCVVTRAEHPQTNEWSHVNETADDNRFENLVPLQAGLNKAVELQRRGTRTASRKGASTWPSELELKSLDSISREHFNYGRHNHGYGCVLVGAYTARQYHQDYDNAVVFTAYAVEHLRALGRYDLIGKTLTEYVLGLPDKAKKGLGPYARGRLATSIASMYQDLADLHNYDKWYELAKGLISKDGDTPRAKRELDRLDWKQIATMVARNDDPAQLLKKWRSRCAIFPFDEWNVMQWEARHALKQRGKKSAQRKLAVRRKLASLHKKNRLLSINSPDLRGRVSVWTYAELLLTYARTEDTEVGADKYRSVAFEIFRTHRILPTRLDGIDEDMASFQKRNINLNALRIELRPKRLPTETRKVIEKELNPVL